MIAPRRVPWIALGLALLAAAAVWAGPLVRAHPGLLRPCLFKAVTGLPCVTCGLTRCSLALLAGHPGEALHWHPLAALAIFLSPLAMAWDLRRAWRMEPYPPLPEGRLPRMGLALLLAGTWILQIVRGI